MDGVNLSTPKVKTAVQWVLNTVGCLLTSLRFYTYSSVKTSKLQEQGIIVELMNTLFKVITFNLVKSGQSN